MANQKIWKGRLDKLPDKVAEKFTSSINIDKKLYLEDLTGSAAYAIGLENIGIITNLELKEILSGLKKIRTDIEAGKVDFFSYEDIHSLVEYELGHLTPDGADKIHTGRSRNDQVVTDELLFLKKCLVEIAGKLLELMSSLVEIAEKNHDLIFPAYTHLQKAQPVLVSHYFLAYFQKFKRNLDKLLFDFESFDYLPLGAAACTGSGYDLNSDLLCRILKFKETGQNSMDIVSSRDYIVDFIYSMSSIMLNLSRFCEDLIIYNSLEFSLIEIKDEFCTGSSIMPQKKNPDVLELIRGKSAVVSGNLFQVVTLLKGLPLTYNSDMQEDKKILFSAYKETRDSLEVFLPVLSSISFKKAR